ncbi:toll/interleukin-1 receptor domain-containing protein [Rhodococcus sp. APC 3903]|uniref:toll/interleukin-1 receptor domain-containing protein n=1 Tax=Rhodococcus sp. APC 3903 TaxID=3035193 RepID=UPI0025B5D818|nr:toll/interleukin-1 receptor domain-containing protein [Rhodococcus sp. APC 3903]MDN3460686.1 toll/interleukin-1 receptor domain-containing protein [Rhodococcus sp. APC 3903]
MSAESELKRYRTEAERLRKDIGSASGAVADKRKKALAAAQAADKSKSLSTQRSKRAEADRLTKAANDAEKKRADLEKKLAATEVKANNAQGKVDKERTAQDQTRERKLEELTRANDRAASQFTSPLVNRTAPSPVHRAATSAPPISLERPEHDVFLSHASEDKDEIARPLKEALEALGVSVWFDEIRIKVGHSIRQSIEEGISNSRFGVVIISPDFFAKQWTNAELDALFGKKMDTGENLVLPVWHHVSKDEVTRHSPLLAGILALNTAIMTVDEVAAALAEAVREEAVPSAQ